MIGLALVSLACAASLWDDAFSSASLDFRFSRTEIDERMQEWLQSQGFSLKKMRHSLLFDENDEPKNYIELELGLRNLEELTQKGINIWSWNGRWFRPGQKEELQIFLDPEGRLVGFVHDVEEAWAAPKINKQKARLLAEDFLKKYVTQHPLSRLRFIEDSTDEKPHRTDYTFTWERTDLRAKDAPYRVGIGIIGNQVGSYSEYLKIPENWTRDFQKKHSLNDLCQSNAERVLLVLYVGMIVFFIIYCYQRRLDWRRGLPWGWLLLFAIVTIASALNQIPTIMASYDTQDNWAAYLVKQGSMTLIEAIKTVVILWLMVLVIDPLYREKLQQHLPFRIGLGPNSLQYGETARSIGLGTVFACFSTAYVAIFYVVGKHVGVWSPVEIDYSKALSGWLPWVEPLETGLSAAFNEEFLFRAFAILFYWKIVRVRWLSVVLAAATWGFLHSNYPQMPGYIRGVELTMEGTLWGILMLRYGLLTTLTAHYLYDCWLDSLIVIRSPSPSDQIGAVIVSMWPLACGLWAWFAYGRKGLLKDYTGEMTPSSEPALPTTHWWESPMEAWNFSLPFLKPIRCWMILLTCVLVLALVRLPRLPQNVFHSFGFVAWARHQISDETDKLLSRKSKKPPDYYKTVSLTSGYLPNHDDAVRYLLESATLDRVAELAKHEWPDLQWNVRCFRPGEKEEFRFTFDSYGNLKSWDHPIENEAKGASLEKLKALELAKEHLVRDYGLNPANENIVQDDLDQEANRRDYQFTFERKDFKWNEAKLRSSIRVQGNEVLGFAHYLKLPEAWLREQSASEWKDVLVSQFYQWTNMVWMGFLLILFVLMISKRILPWKRAFLIATIPALFGVMDSLNELPSFFVGYDTTTPVWHYVGEKLESFVFHTGLDYLFQVLELSIALGFLQWAFQWKLENLRLWPASKVERQRLWLTACALAWVGVAAWNAKGLLDAFATGWLLPEHAVGYSYPQINTAFPWLSALTSAFMAGYNGLLSTALKIGLVVVLYRILPKTTWCLLVLIPVYNALGARTWTNFGCTIASNELQWLLNLILVWRLWRFNALAIFLAFYSEQLLTSTGVFFMKGGPCYQWTSLPLALCLVFPVIMACLMRKTHPPSDGPTHLVRTS